MATYKVKLSKRYALRLLATQDCRVKLDSEFNPEWQGKIFTTDHTWFDKGSDVIFIKELGTCEDFENIKAIEHQATRFMPDLLVFEEVDWE